MEGDINPSLGCNCLKFGLNIGITKNSPVKTLKQASGQYKKIPARGD
jgi:hypothetical protein